MQADSLDWNLSNLDRSIWPMRITEQTRYALRIIVLCARRYPERIKVADLSRMTGITNYNIFKLLKIVTKAGILDSSRGPKGGITMTMSPEQLTVGQVVRLLEPRFQACGPARTMSSYDDGHSDESERRVNAIIGRGIKAFLAELDTITISVLMGRMK
ncbi:MAG: Rrf2 family transcriptional regulator [Hyphomicrobiales bacterium]|nr:Rrf2 family transcriptional regulator [Hyphomicrobiales bacterium]